MQHLYYLGFKCWKYNSVVSVICKMELLCCPSRCRLRHSSLLPSSSIEKGSSYADSILLPQNINQITQIIYDGVGRTTKPPEELSKLYIGNFEAPVPPTSMGCPNIEWVDGDPPSLHGGEYTLAEIR
ncbi:uncharacterized protein LOC113376099 [Ctenocephalides felis]|uniref:uncharacterized protein LOC113376099 n=1 Tax=Ctenocephalides felis TaxID=7515 RepID=UPI000E6E323A|nr:uncharacterized protein LOC113376099 [Ctenocephalides felis]